MARFQALTQGLDQAAESAARMAASARDAAAATSSARAEASRANSTFESAGDAAEEMADRVSAESKRAATAAGELERSVRGPLAGLDALIGPASRSIEELRLQIATFTFEDANGNIITEQVPILTGDILKLHDALNGFLPASDEVLRRLGELRQRARDDELSIEEILQRLGESYNGLARNITEAVEAFASGKLRLEELLTLLQEIARLLPDQETGILANELADILNDQRRRGLL